MEVHLDTRLVRRVGRVVAARTTAHVDHGGVAASQLHRDASAVWLQQARERLGSIPVSSDAQCRSWKGGLSAWGFRDFIARGNVIDLAVGIVIGAAFGAIVGLYFFIVLPFSRFTSAPAKPAPPNPQEVLLTQIRDLLAAEDSRGAALSTPRGDGHGNQRMKGHEDESL